MRGDYKQADYGKVILPFTVLRRLDCVLEPSKEKVLDFYHNKLPAMKLKNPEPVLNRIAGYAFHNTSKFTFQKLTEDPNHVAANLKNYINGFSVSGREIIEYFNFNSHIDRLNEANLLFKVIQLFYNTGIFTYIWILTNRKSPERKGKVQLLNAISFYQKMSRSLGNKRNIICDGEECQPDQIAEITRIYGDFTGSEFCQIFDNEDFGYRRITVKRPLRLNFQISAERLERLDDETAFANLARSKKKGQAARDEIAEGEQLQADIKAMLAAMKTGPVFETEPVCRDRAAFETALNGAIKASGLKITPSLKRAILNALSERDETAAICRNSKGEPEPDTGLRDYENVPLKEDVQTYFEREVLPHVPDAWIDHNRTVTGYEISFTRYFYQYQPLRSLADIRADILALEAETEGMLHEVLGEEDWRSLGDCASLEVQP